MKFRFFIYTTLSLCLLSAYSQNAVAEDNTTIAKTSSLNNSTNSKIIGSSVPKTSDFIQKGTKGIIYCLGLLILAYGLKRKMHGKTAHEKDNPITVLARKSLGQRCSLVLVDVDGKRLLLSHSFDCLSLISELDDLNYINNTKAESFEKNLTLAVNE